MTTSNGNAVDSARRGETSGALDTGRPIEVLFRTARPATDPKGRYPGFAPGVTTLSAGTVVTPGARPLSCDILFERDVAVTLRDGTVMYADVFRPAGGTDLPALVAWSPYGKEGGNQVLDDFPFRAGVAKDAVSGLQKWEAPDPAYWCQHGYAVVNPDNRGAYMSGGDVYFWGPQDAQDGYDFIEWLAAQEWCNGRVGMAGNSWLAIAQWFIAAARPPHLAAIAPWEGITDLYRHDVVRGGIPDPGFNETIVDLTCGGGRVEDVPAMVRRYPLMNGYWRDKSAALEQIEVPAYVVASWTNILHTTGTLQGYERISSAEKWLRVHNTQEWADFYDPAHQDDLRRFFDRYLRGLQNGWETTPRVRLTILDPGGTDTVDRPEEGFPLSRTEYRALYLDTPAGGPPVAEATNRSGAKPSSSVATGALSRQLPDAEAAVRYAAADGTGKAVFSVTFDRDTELAGHLKLRLWVEAEGADDMDLFVKVEKLDRRGRLLFVPTIPLPNPVARRLTPVLYRRGVKRLALLFFSGAEGRLRVSHRALDPERSTPEQPHLAHESEERLAPGEIVPVEIAIRPLGMRWLAGQKLRLTVAGYDLSPIPLPGIAPPELRNQGQHVIHTGGRYDSHLLVPVVSG